VFAGKRAEDCISSCARGSDASSRGLHEARLYGSHRDRCGCGRLSTFADQAYVVRALAETHIELVLIHPFRDGNGRLARVLSTLMALQAGLPLLDFSLMAGTGKTAYIAAIQAGLDKHYAPMEKLFGEIIEQSRLSS
jgi:fido (protein-threonine AMPylation protein)